MPRLRRQLAKVTRPRLHNAVARERLFVLLDRAHERRRAIGVIGPPGAGKTTLVASWLDARKIDGIWYQVDPGDADLATFFHYLHRAAEPFVRGKRVALPALTPEYLSDVAAFARRFFRELFARLPTGATLVLDNYQQVSADALFHEIVADAVQEVPDGLSLIVVSRRDPPNSYARLIVCEDVGFVEWADLKLTFDEARLIALARKQSESGAIRDAYERSGGWAAGAVLLLESHRLAAEQGGRRAAEPQQMIFSYFAAQIFERASQPVRELLLATADLPWVELELAESLTGNANATQVLEDLCRRHLFTHRRTGQSASYLYHAMFQTFLQAQADVLLDSRRRKELRVRAAQYFEGAGHAAEAFGLYRDACAWTDAAQLVLRQAQGMIGEGRFRTLSEWIGALPHAAIDAEPWLAYWRGRALVSLDPDSGRRQLEQAYDLFRCQSEVVGEVAAAAGVVDSIYIGNRDFFVMDPWITIIERRLVAMERMPSAAMELRVYSATLIALLYRQPGNPLIDHCLARLLSMVEAEGDNDSRVSAALSVLTYASASGNFAIGHRARQLIQPIVDSEEVAEASRFLWHAWSGYFDMLTGNYAAAEASYERATVLNEDNRFAWAANLLFCRALSYCSVGDRARALPNLDGLAAISNRARPQDVGYLHVAQAWKGMVTNNPEFALREAEGALDIAEAIGNFSLRVIWRAPKAWALVALDRNTEFESFMQSTLELVRGTCYLRPHVEFSTLRAWMFARLGRWDEARSILRDTLTLARQLDHDAFVYRLCHFAVELRDLLLGMSEDETHVRSLIRRFHWPGPPATDIGWPWRIRVYTLGRFLVELDGAPLSYGRKTPRRPLLLLKALIAFGGERVPEAKLIDALWPEEVGDTAHHAFGLARHRLRRLLQDAESITLVDGVLSLNRNLVWFDADAFELLARDDRLDPDSWARAIDLYSGEFLPDESGLPWTASTRERLRARFLRVVDERGGALEKAGSLDEAISLYLDCLKVEPVAELAYQGLIRCYTKQGRKADALATYRRLRQLLADVLGVQPSGATEALGWETESR